MSTPKPVRPKRENPERLRECPNALARASTNDVYRVELSASGAGIKLLITCSSEAKEQAIADRIVSELRPYFETLARVAKGGRLGGGNG